MKTTQIMTINRNCSRTQIPSLGNINQSIMWDIPLANIASFRCWAAPWLNTTSNRHVWVRRLLLWIMPWLNTTSNIHVCVRRLLLWIMPWLNTTSNWHVSWVRRVLKAMSIMTLDMHTNWQLSNYIICLTAPNMVQGTQSAYVCRW